MKRVGLALLIGGLLLASGPGAAQPRFGQPRPPGMAQPPARPGGIEWIDVHVHPVGGRGQTQDYAGAVMAALAMMDQERISKMILMPPPQVHGSPPPFDHESFAFAVKRHPARLAFLGGGGSLNPMIQEAAGETTVSDRLRRRFEEKADEIIREGAVGFGEMTTSRTCLATPTSRWPPTTPSSCCSPTSPRATTS